MFPLLFVLLVIVLSVLFRFTASDNPFWYFQTFAKPDLGNWRLHLLKRIALSISNRIYLQDTNYLLQDVHLYSEGLC